MQLRMKGEKLLAELVQATVDSDEYDDILIRFEQLKVERKLLEAEEDQRMQVIFHLVNSANEFSIFSSLRIHEGGENLSAKSCHFAISCIHVLCMVCILSCELFKNYLLHIFFVYTVR